ncbi:hypothetical protein UO65_5864 [Actinokineospora spheciospongiae]|uniref:Uncharacterized protein n=1 Tax=Actinokineospora spheciospongiae TaxID=909613 RepID=W7IQ51_9PSEU|nr:hypothetical protein [Actinokineospora spheciospongiae]EWC58862.1 hypothetical protein UO65_5864 [Actinokineospora spheciospongiae]
MNAITVSPPMLFAGVGILLGLLIVWRAGARKVRAATEAARTGARAVSLVGRVLVLGGLITGVQWVVITYAADNTSLLLSVLGLPALFTAATLVRTLTVVADGPRRRGGKR